MGGLVFVVVTGYHTETQEFSPRGAPVRIIIRYSEACRDDLREWLARLPGAVEDRRRLVDNAIAELNEELVRTTGIPRASNTARNRRRRATGGTSPATVGRATS